ncbi:MAG: sugar ABC transporter ATP-binding protein, partial [Eubacteriales bacterium]|nr:sugar ABC transporter ATP-binding protein [Eubacteriales bacterium]
LTILRDGQHISTCSVSEMDKHRLISLMVGRDVTDEYPLKQGTQGKEVLRVTGLTSKKRRLKDISFSLKKGEILGISGLVGAGRTEVAKILFGAYSKDSGEILLNGKNCECRNIQQAVRKSIALVPENRKQEGLVLDMQVQNNISMANFKNILTNHVLSKKKETSLAQKYVDILGISVPSMTSKTKNLSGGNQQKVVLAKWLAAESDVIIFDEPTRGIDVGAKAEIYKLMAELADQGKAIIMISSEMPELIGMSDRMIVMHEGRVMGELEKSEFSQERIMGMLVGEN